MRDIRNGVPEHLDLAVDVLQSDHSDGARTRSFMRREHERRTAAIGERKGVEADIRQRATPAPAASPFSVAQLCEMPACEPWCGALSQSASRQYPRRLPAPSGPAIAPPALPTPSAHFAASAGCPSHRRTTAFPRFANPTRRRFVPSPRASTPTAWARSSNPRGCHARASDDPDRPLCWETPVQRRQPVVEVCFRPACALAWDGLGSTGAAGA